MKETGEMARRLSWSVSSVASEGSVGELGEERVRVGKLGEEGMMVMVMFRLGWTREIWLSRS